MVFKDYQCIGYHGTEKEKADVIIASKKFIESNSGKDWLGKGVYFFEDDIQQAINFVSKARKVESYKIIKANIKSNKWLDLIKVENYSELQVIAEELEKRNLSILKKYKLNNAVIIDFMYKIEKFDVVSAVFEYNNKRIKNSNIMPMQIQICVKNMDCIFDIQGVD